MEKAKGLNQIIKMIQSKVNLLLNYICLTKCDLYVTMFNILKCDPILQIHFFWDTEVQQLRLIRFLARYHNLQLYQFPQSNLQQIVSESQTEKHSSSLTINISIYCILLSSSHPRDNTNIYMLY